MDDDIIEKPSCKILYRQSSIETRLSPIHLSEDDIDISDASDEEEKTVPKIVKFKLKSTEEDPEETESNNVNQNKTYNHEAKKVSNLKEKYEEPNSLHRNSIRNEILPEEIPPEHNKQESSASSKPTEKEFSAGVLKGSRSVIIHNFEKIDKIKHRNQTRFYFFGLNKLLVKPQVLLVSTAILRDN